MIYSIETSNITNPALLLASLRQTPVSILASGYCSMRPGMFVAIVEPSNKKRPKQRDVEQSRDEWHKFNAGATVQMKLITEAEMNKIIPNLTQQMNT